MSGIVAPATVINSHVVGHSSVPVTPTCWFVADWHSVHLSGYFSRSLRRFFDGERSQAFLKFELGTGLRIGFAWRCNGRKLTTIIREEPERMEEGVVGGSRGGTRHSV